MSQPPDERSQNYPDDSLTPLGHQNPLGVHHGLGQLGLQTKGLAGGSSLSILDPDIFFPNGLPEIDLSGDEVASTNQSAPSSPFEQATSTTPSIQPQRIEHSQSHKTNTNQSPQQQSSQPNHQLNKQPSNQHTNQTSQLHTNPPNAPAIQPSLDNAPGQSAGNQANSAPSPHPIQRILSDQPETIPQSAQLLEQIQPAAESSSPPTIQAKESIPESNSAKLSEPNQAAQQSEESALPKPIEAVSKAQSPHKQQSSNSQKKGTEKLTHTDIQRYFDPQPQTSSGNSFSDHSVINSDEQVIQAKSLANESNTDSSSSPSTELGLMGDAKPTPDASSGNAIAPAQPSSSATEQRLVGDAHSTQISSRDAIAPAQPSLTTSDQQISRSVSEPVSPTDQQSTNDNFAASDSTSHSQELSANTPEALQQASSIQRAASTSDSSSTLKASQQTPSIQRVASTSDSSSTPEALQQAPSIQQVAATSNDLSPINPDHQSLATTIASEDAKTSFNKKIDTGSYPASHSSSSDQAGTTINRKAVSSSTSSESKVAAENSSAPTNINSINKPTSIQQEPESSQVDNSTSPEPQPLIAVTPAPQHTINRSTDEQYRSIATPSALPELSEPKSPELDTQPPSSVQRSTETNEAPSSVTRQERSFLQRYFSPDPKPSSSNSASSDSPQPKPLSSSQASNNLSASEQPSNQLNPEIASVYESEPIINRSVEQPNPLPIAESIEQSASTNAEPHTEQIQRQESLANSDIGSIEVRSQSKESIQQETNTAAATPDPRIPPQIQQEPENQLEQFNSSAALSATSDNQPSIQAQLEPRNKPGDNQTDQPNNQPARSAQIDLDQVKIQQQSGSENINRTSSIPEQYDSHLEADGIAKGQSIKESLEPTVSIGQSIDSVQPKLDTATQERINFTQSKTDISNHQSVRQLQLESITNQPVKPIQKVGHAVNRLMRFFANQVNPPPANQTNQINQTAPAENQKLESVDASTILSESKIESSTLTSNLVSSSGNQPIQKYSDNTSDLDHPENDVSSLQLSTDPETTFSTKPIISSESLSSDTVRFKSDSEDSQIEQSSPISDQTTTSNNKTTDFHETETLNVTDLATSRSTPDLQFKSDHIQLVNLDDSKAHPAQASKSLSNQPIQASATGSVANSILGSAAHPSVNNEAQSTTSTSSNQAAEADTASSHLATELQSRNSISEPTRSAEIQSADHIQRSSQTGEFSNTVDENLGSASVESITSLNQPSAIAPDPLSTSHTDTPHEQPPQRQIENTSSITAQSDTHLQRDVQQLHQQNHSVEPSSNITSGTTADSQPANIQHASASSAGDAIAVSPAPTTPISTTPNETVQRLTDSNFTVQAETAQTSHAIASNRSEHSLDNHVSADSSPVSPVVQQSNTDQNILNRNTDEIASTRELPAAQPAYSSSENHSVNEQQSFSTFSNEASQEAPASLLKAASDIQASHLPTVQTPSSEQSAQELQEALFTGTLSTQASSAQTAESQAPEQPDIQSKQDSDLRSRSLPELENNLQRKPEPESIATSEIETTARPSAQPNTTLQSAAQTPPAQAQSTQPSSTQPVPAQPAVPDFNQPSAQTPTVQAQWTQTNPEQANVDHSEQTQPSTQVPSVQAKPGQADPEPAGSENLEPSQSEAETLPVQSLPAQTPSVQAQTSQSSPEQAGLEYLNPNQSSAPVPSVQARSTQADLEQASSEYVEPNQPLTPEPSVQATSTQANLEQADSGQPIPLQPTVHTPDVQAKSAQTNAEQAASAADQQVDQTPITVLQPIGILRSLTTTPISTTAIQSKASQDKQIEPQVSAQTPAQRQNANLELSSYQDQSPAGEGLAGDSLPAYTTSNASNLQQQTAATESVLNESADAAQFQQANDSYAVQPETRQSLADVQRQFTNQTNPGPNLAESSYSISPTAEQDSNDTPTPNSVQRSVEHPTANQISTDQPFINRSLADAVDPAATQRSIQPRSLLDTFNTSVNQTSGTPTTIETDNRPESLQSGRYHLQASPKKEQPGNPRTGSQKAIPTPTNLVQRSSAEQADQSTLTNLVQESNTERADQEESTQPNPASDQIQRSPSAETPQAAVPLAEPIQPATQQPDDIQRDQLVDNKRIETVAQPVQSLSQQQSFSQQHANPIQRSQLDSSQPADSSLDMGVPAQWSSLEDLVEQTQHLSAPTPPGSAPGETFGLPEVQRQVDSPRAADSETIQDSTVDAVQGKREGAIAPPTPPSPSSSIPTQWSSLEDLVQQMPSLESSADTVRQQAETAQPSEIQRKSASHIKEKTPQASSVLSSQKETQPKSQSTLQPVRQASKPRSTLSVSRVAPVRSSQHIPATQTQVQAKFNPSRTNLGATLIQASEDEPFVTISRSGGGSEAVADYAEALELLAQEIYSLLRQRLAIEQERHGAGYPNRFR